MGETLAAVGAAAEEQGQGAEEHDEDSSDEEPLEAEAEQAELSTASEQLARSEQLALSVATNDGESAEGMVEGAGGAEGAEGALRAASADAVDGSQMSHPLDLLAASPPASSPPLTADSPPSPMYGAGAAGANKSLSSPQFSPNGGLGLGALPVGGGGGGGAGGAGGVEAASGLNPRLPAQIKGLAHLLNFKLCR